MTGSALQSDGRSLGVGRHKKLSLIIMLLSTVLFIMSLYIIIINLMNKKPREGVTRVSDRTWRRAGGFMVLALFCIFSLMLALVGDLGRHVGSSWRSLAPFCRQVVARWRQDGPT